MLAELYPASLITAGLERQHIYDFHIDYHRHWAGKSRPYHFRCGSEHFRMAEQAQLVATFEWGLNWCVAAWQQKYLAIHAAVLEKNGQALIMPAPPGSGKSTLCALLMLNGWRLLTDEMCLIDPDSGIIHPYVRPLSLKNQSIDVIKHYHPQCRIFHRTKDTEKGTVAYLRPTDLSWQQYQHTAKAAWVLFPQYSVNAGAAELYALPKADCLMYLAQNSFNYSAYGKDGFDCLCRLVEQTDCFRLEYHDTGMMLDMLEQLLC